MQKKKNHFIKNEEGFTLVEIIAVLVILGILAAVAIPKYFDLQSEARDKALDAALSEAVGRVNGKFAKAILGGSTSETINYTAVAVGTDMGDFTLSMPAGSGTGTADMTLKVLGKVGALTGMSKTKTIKRPGTP